MNKQEILSKMKNQVLVSCQAYDENPHATVADMVKMAVAAKMAGAIGYRANSPEYVKAIREETGEDMIIIGIWKLFVADNDVYITTTMEAVDGLVAAGSNVVALDCTDRVNAYGYKGVTLIPQILVKYPDLVIMADCSTIEEAKAAKEAGADIIASTMSGYTEYTAEKAKEDVDIEFLNAMSNVEGAFVLAEGRIWTREDAVAAFKAGADCLVIGTAITNPWKITERFVKAKDKYFN